MWGGEGGERGERRGGGEREGGEREEREVSEGEEEEKVGGSARRTRVIYLMYV